MELQKAASKRRRKMKTRKFMKLPKGSKHSRSVADMMARAIGGGYGLKQEHAMGGGRSNFGASPIFLPKRGKFKGYMRTA